MKIIKNGENEFILCYKYKIITNRSKRNEKTYFFYTTHFSNELVEYFGTNEYWIYSKNDTVYLTTEQPYEYNCKKLVAREKYKTSDLKVIPLNPKFFNLVGDVTDKYLKIIVYLNETDLVSDDIKIELKVE